MASLTKKLINGRPYYYLRETARVGGKPKVVRTTYLGRAEDILARLEQGSEPLRVESRSFGAVAAALKLARELGLAEAIDRACGSRGRPSVGTYIALAAGNPPRRAPPQPALPHPDAPTAPAPPVPPPAQRPSS